MCSYLYQFEFCRVQNQIYIWLPSGHTYSYVCQKLQYTSTVTKVIDDIIVRSIQDGTSIYPKCDLTIILDNIMEWLDEGNNKIYLHRTAFQVIHTPQPKIIKNSLQQLIIAVMGYKAGVPSVLCTGFIVCPFIQHWSKNDTVVSKVTTLKGCGG